MSNLSLKQVLPTSVPTPSATNVRLFSNLNSGGELYYKDNSGNSIPVAGAVDPVINPVTYTQLFTLYTSAQFVTGSYYLITNFETIYRQPDFYVDGSIKTNLTLKSKPSGWVYQPILVQAISNSALSVDAYQPNITGGAYTGFHKDKIKYNFLYNTTEFGDITKGRIISRVDEFGNETDYDHRTVQFKRYMGYSKTTLLTGTITDYNCISGAISGSGTLFSSQLSVGDIIILDTKSNLGYDIGLKVKIIGSNVSMNVEVDSLYSSGIPSPVNLSNSTIISANNYSFSGQSYTLSKATATGDYDQYKEVYFGQSDANDYDEFYTFPTGAYNNKLGNYSNYYLESGSGNLLLPNIVFLTLATYNNFYQIWNSTFNICRENICSSQFHDNTIVDFRQNIVSSSFYNNNLGMIYNNTFSQAFYNNTLPSTAYLRNNKFNATTNDIDFTGSMHVSQNYNCEIFENSSSVVKLSYYNGSNVLNVVDVNS